MTSNQRLTHKTECKDTKEGTPNEETEDKTIKTDSSGIKLTLYKIDF